VAKDRVSRRFLRRKVVLGEGDFRHFLDCTMRDWRFCEEGPVIALFDPLVSRTPFESGFQCYDSLFVVDTERFSEWWLVREFSLLLLFPEKCIHV